MLNPNQVLDADLTAAYAQWNPDGHFFDPESMRFWGSKISTKLQKREDGCIFFLTIEDNFDRTERLYTLRVLIPKQDGGIKTLSFQNHKDKDKAVEKLKEYKKTFVIPD